VDIAGHLDAKLEAIGCCASQFPPEKAHIYPRVRAMTETVGLMAGCAARFFRNGALRPSHTQNGLQTTKKWRIGRPEQGGGSIDRQREEGISGTAGWSIRRQRGERRIARSMTRFAR